MVLRNVSWEIYEQLAEGLDRRLPLLNFESQTARHDERSA